MVAGSAYVIAATRDHPRLTALVIYPASGGVEFIVQAWLLTRRGRHLATAE